MADHENFVLEPFVKLCEKPGFEKCQVIEAGCAIAPDVPGLGIAWRWDEIERRAVERHTIK